ncbi:MAG: hypothetical protein H6622_01085 [Halobacteriovoraceae bacterium]|nr:hypothetical protein [Halobacteriovoraceae bacterium]
MKICLVALFVFSFSVFSSDKEIGNCQSKFSSSSISDLDLYFKIVDYLDTPLVDNLEKVDINNFRRLFLKLKKLQSESPILPTKNLVEIEERFSALNMKGARILIFGDGKKSQQRFLYNLGHYTNDSKFIQPASDLPEHQHDLIAEAFTYFENAKGPNETKATAEGLSNIFSIPKNDIHFLKNTGDKNAKFSDLKNLLLKSISHKLFHTTFSSAYENLHFINLPSLEDFELKNEKIRNIVAGSNIVIAFLSEDYQSTIDEMKRLGRYLKKYPNKKVLIVLGHNYFEKVQLSPQEYVQNVIRELFPYDKRKNEILGAWKLDNFSNTTPRAVPLKIDDFQTPELRKVFNDLNKSTSEFDKRRIVDFSHFFRDKVREGAINEIVYNHSINFLRTIILKILYNESKNLEEILFNDKVLKGMKKILRNEFEQNVHLKKLNEVSQKIRGAEVTGINVSAKVLLEVQNIITKSIARFKNDEEFSLEIAEYLKEIDASQKYLFKSFWNRVKYISKEEMNEELKEVVKLIQIDLSRINVNLEDSKVEAKVKGAIREFQDTWYGKMVRGLSNKFSRSLTEDTQKFRVDLISLFEQGFKGIFTQYPENENRLHKKIFKQVTNSKIGKLSFPVVPRVCRDGLYLASIAGLIGTIAVILEDDHNLDVSGLSHHEGEESATQKMSELEPYQKGMIAVAGGYALFETIKFIQNASMNKQVSCNLKQGYRDLVFNSGKGFFENQLTSKISDKKIENTPLFSKLVEDSSQLSLRTRKFAKDYSIQKFELLSDRYITGIEQKIHEFIENKKGLITQSDLDFEIIKLIRFMHEDPQALENINNEAQERSEFIEVSEGELIEEQYDRSFTWETKK